MRNLLGKLFKWAGSRTVKRDSTKAAIQSVVDATWYFSAVNLRNPALGGNFTAPVESPGEQDALLQALAKFDIKGMPHRSDELGLTVKVQPPYNRSKVGSPEDNALKLADFLTGHSDGRQNVLFHPLQLREEAIAGLMAAFTVASDRTSGLILCHTAWERGCVIIYEDDGTLRVPSGLNVRPAEKGLGAKAGMAYGR